MENQEFGKVYIVTKKEFFEYCMRKGQEYTKIFSHEIAPTLCVCRDSDYLVSM